MLGNLHLGLTEWEVELAISGAIAIERNIVKMHVEKGEQNPFTTTVTLEKAPKGVKCILVARAFDQVTANDAAVYFVGQALDVLSLRLDIPLYLSLFQPEYRSISAHVRRRVNQEEWFKAFKIGRSYSMNRHFLSRAISWYRKGLVSEDPIDRVIAFWSALEAVCSKYFCPNERTNLGIINKVCDCFDQLWGSSENWHVIPGEPTYLNKFHEFRNGFSHGFRRVDIETIRDVSKDLPIYQKLAREFLLEWEINGSIIERNRPTQEREKANGNLYTDSG
jgi:hypothetical protein